MSGPARGARIGSRHVPGRFPGHHAYPAYGGLPIYYGDALGYGYEYVPEPSTPVVVNNIIPDQGAEKPSAAVPTAPAVPMMLEREGDHWVRRQMENAPVPAAKGKQRSEREQTKEKAASSEKPLPPTTLILRDGRRIEVENYTIYRGAISYSEPAWGPRHEIMLSQLNIPATIRANKENGLDFELPTSGSEIMMRP